MVMDPSKTSSPVVLNVAVTAEVQRASSHAETFMAPDVKSYMRMSGFPAAPTATDDATLMVPSLWSVAVGPTLLQSGVAYVGGYQGAPISHLMDVLTDAEDILTELGVHFEASASEATAAATGQACL